MILRFSVKHAITGETIVDNYYTCDYVTAYNDVIFRVSEWFARFALTDWIAGTRQQFDPIVITLSSCIRRD